MKPFEIVRRRIAIVGGKYAEVPENGPPDIWTWSCFAFFVPGGDIADLRKRITVPNIDVNQVVDGCWVYGGYSWLERVRTELGCRA